MSKPRRTTTELIRADLSPTLATLYGIYSAYGSYGEQVLGRSEPDDHRPSTDFYLWMNGGFLATLIALALVAVLALLGAIR